MSYATLQENFEKALETINSLSEQNEVLMDQIQDLKLKLTLSESEIDIPKVEVDDRKYKQISEGAEAAMKRYKQFLKKEFPHAKSKQSKRQSV